MVWGLCGVGLFVAVSVAILGCRIMIKKVQTVRRTVSQGSGLSWGIATKGVRVNVGPLILA